MTFTTSQYITITGKFVSPTSGGNATDYVLWTADSDAGVDYISLGVNTKIRRLTVCYSDGASIGINGGESLSFSIGTTNGVLTTFTPYTGGTDVIVWTNTVNGTKPTTSVNLNIPTLSTDRIAVRSVEVGNVTPSNSNITVLLTLELNVSPVS